MAQTLDEANAMFATVKTFEGSCHKHFKVLEDAAAAANRMTTHKEADVEVAELKERYAKVKAVADEWMKKCDTLVKEWQLLDNTVTELNSWVAQDRGAEAEQTSLWKKWSPRWENSKTFSKRKKSWWKIFKQNILYTQKTKTSTHLHINNDNNDIMDIMLAFIL